VQADEILARARKAADAQEAAALSEARTKREELLEQTKRDIEAETRRAIQEIRKEVADLTILATEKVTRKTLTDDDQRRLVEEALSELDFSALAGDRRH
jgi:F-type H+-transporting ATPase subunit b